VLFISACGKSEVNNGEYPYGHYEDDKMIGTVWEVKKSEDSIVVDISEWEKRDRKGPNMTDEGYSYTAKMTDGTVIKYEDGTNASIDDIKKGQKVLVNPPRGNNFEGHPEEIILLEMTYKEKYSRLLSHIDGLNLVVMYEDGKKLPFEMQEPIYENILDILENKEERAVAAWMEYNEDYVVDYKEELGIETFPVLLVFNKEELVFKTYNVDELYDFFKNLKE
jgi:co-chaperonin GroES (HSP10)